MKTHTSVWKFGCGLLLCLLGLQGARAQKQDVELDATAIDFHSLFVGRNELFPDNVHPSDYIGTYTNEAGCRDQLVMKRKRDKAITKRKCCASSMAGLPNP